MSAIPDFLPAANSRKWHNRQTWDRLGYTRVRTLANPAWNRDVPWLRLVLETDARHESSVDVRSALRTAATLAARYPRDGSGSVNAERAWRELLDAIDQALAVRQSEHLAAVRAAGCSGI